MNFSLRIVVRAFRVLGFALGVLLPVSVPARSVIEAGVPTVWRYLADGTEPGAGWTQPGFADANWKSGPAPLGYGGTRLTTVVPSSEGGLPRPIATRFRHAFEPAPLQAGERLVVLLSMDDGAVVYLNGRECGRANLPKGPLTSQTLARREITNGGFYVRVPVPANALLPGQTNVLAVEVRQASTNDSDLFFDLALKVVPAGPTSVKVAPAAREVMSAYLKKHFIGPDMAVPDGYIDGGRHMRVAADGRAQSGREILLVDRPHDPALAGPLEFARAPDLRLLPPLERTQRLAAYIDELTTPPGGARWVGPTVEQLQREFANQALRIGDVIDQGQAGVCRHRALLFKILADEAGLPAALVRGNYAARGSRGSPHAWNEISLEDGRRLLVDVMHHGGKAIFPEVTDPKVVRRYLRENDKPWYGPRASPASKGTSGAPSAPAP